MSNEPPKPPVSEASTESLKKPKNRKLLAIILLVFLCLCTILLIVMYALNNTQGNPSTTDPISFPDSNNNGKDDEEEPTPLTQDKIFYTQKGNILSYDLNTKKVVKLTNYPESNPAQVQAVRVIDGNNVGFARCVIVTGDFGCTINTIDLTTEKITEKKNLDKKQFVMTVDFATVNKFAYLVTNDTKWQVYYSNSGSSKILENITITAYGRGGFVEDSQKLRFSPDGTKLFEVVTSSPRSSEDFNIYLFDLNDNSKKTVADATQAEWLDDDRIIFRTYDNAGATSDNGLSVYTVSTSSQLKIEDITSTAYNPSVLIPTEKVIYSDNSTQKVWRYDLTNQQNTKLVDSGIDGFWGSATKVVYIEVEKCEEGDEICGFTGAPYKNKAYSVWDITNNTKTVTPLDIELVSYVTSLYN